jgi:hypothetical protein
MHSNLEAVRGSVCAAAKIQKMWRIVRLAVDFSLFLAIVGNCKAVPFDGLHLLGLRQALHYPYCI